MPRHATGRIVLLVVCLVLFGCNIPLLAAAPARTPVPPVALASLPASEPYPPGQASPTPFYPLDPTGAPPAPAATEIVPTSPIIPAYEPVFEPGECDFAVPTGYRPECGDLVVPEERARPDSPSVRLHVAIFRSRASDPAPDPVVHLAGGPGGSSLDEAGYLFQQGLGAILEKRDFILFDQRGTGHSQPRLDCPEREALAPILLEGHLLPGESVRAILEAFQLCHDRLVSDGVDPGAYNSAASAADVFDLARALGYAQVNLYGVSYGTRLGLTLLRDYPRVVRSAVLDSVYPPQVNLYTALAPNAGRAFNVLFDRCAEDSGCNRAYPHLRRVFYQLVDQLNADPSKVSLNAGGARQTVSVDGDLLVDVLFVGLYNPYVTAYMPKMIFDIRQGNYDILRERFRLYFENDSAIGMQMAVQCNEEIPFSTPEDAMAAADGVQPQIAAFFPQSVLPLFEACKIWNHTPLAPRENQPVSSDVPTLVLAGEYDPITPPGWGRLAAESLSNSYFYEYPGNGHWVTRSSGCALAMALAFWNEPDKAPEASCVAEEGGIGWVR